MSVKIVHVPDIGDVSLYKRRGVNGVRMSITHDGKVRVTLPTWAPYKLGIEFARNKSEWIRQQKKPVLALQDGDRVGKAHRLVHASRAISKPNVRINGTDIVVASPHGLEFNDAELQRVAEKGAIKALKKEAEQLLPMRIQTLALEHGFIYNSVVVKKLKSRWGSCNERKDITFNVFLMQLPWHLIDYVILHELMHTKVLRHGQPFWSALDEHIPNLKEVRKEMKQYQPTLTTIPGIPSTDTNTDSAKVIIETS